MGYPNHADDEFAPYDEGWSRFREVGWVPGCLLPGVVGFVLLLVFGLGLGRPNTFWLQIAEVQAFEGEDGVALFVEVRRSMTWAGFARDNGFFKRMQMLRIDVSRDGRVSRASLKFDEHASFNTNVAPIIRLADHFYLVRQRSLGRPNLQLHRLAGDRIEPLSIEESGKILREIGLEGGGHRGPDGSEVEYDVISKRNGWRRLNGDSRVFGWDDPIVSERHGLRLRFVMGDQHAVGAIVAESLPGPEAWSKTLVRVDTRRWKAYHGPRD